MGASSSFYQSGSTGVPLLQGITAFTPIPNNWLTGVSGTGVWSYAQPAFTDISGVATPAQLPFPTPTTIGGVEAVAAVAHQWVNSISTLGVPALSQPAFTDISGTVAASQLPNPSATTLGGVQSIAAVAHQWINSISTLGVPALSQPAFTDISGTASLAQLPALSASNLTNGVTGSGAVVLATAPTLSSVTATGLLTVDSGATTLEHVIKTSDPGATGAVLSFYQNSASPASGDLPSVLNFYGNNSVGTKTNYAHIEAQIADPTSTTEKGNLNFYTTGLNGSLRATINYMGDFVIGAEGIDTEPDVSARLQVWGINVLASSLLGGFSNTAAACPAYIIYRSRGAAINSFTPVQSGDKLGALQFYGQQQTGVRNGQIAASIHCEVDGTVTDGAAADMPGRLLFKTSGDGTASETERLRIDNTGKVLALTPTGGLGYGTGAGGAVTQLTSKATGVTINTICGQITTAASATTAQSSVSFVVTNSTVAATDTVIVNVQSGGTVNGYWAFVTKVAAGSFNITLLPTVSESAAVVLNFAVIKAVNN